MTRPPEDPTERIIYEALCRVGLAFSMDGEAIHPARGLDFYIPDFDLHIEVKQFYSPRIAEQMSRHSNVIVVQGVGAARALASMIGGLTPPRSQ